MTPASTRKTASPAAGHTPAHTGKTAKAAKAVKTAKNGKVEKVEKVSTADVKPRRSASSSPQPSPKSRGNGTAHLPRNENGIVLLSGGNPQIPKGDGDGPVRLYLDNMPGWKSALGKRLDTLIVKAVRNAAKEAKDAKDAKDGKVGTLEKAVRWNSPFYGAGQGWFLSFHVLTKYVKVTFFKGTSLTPMPPGHTAKSGEARWLDIYEDDVLDETQFMDWVRQAARIPGWTA